jgi:hypothetical protein
MRPWALNLDCMAFELWHGRMYQKSCHGVLGARRKQTFENSLKIVKQIFHSQTKPLSEMSI